MKTEKKKRIITLILPLVVLFLFIGLFVGGSINRSLLRKELTEMRENTAKEGNAARLSEIEKRNKTIDFIIGRDKETELLIKELKKQ